MKKKIKGRANGLWISPAGWVCILMLTIFLAVSPPANGQSGETGQEDAIDDGEATALSKMVVTGEKTDRSIYDTGSSVNIYNADRIESASKATEISDLLKMTPNVVDVGNGNDIPTIRGVDGSGPGRGAVAFVTGTRPRINMSLDGRSLTYNELAFGPQSLWDVEQVEVFLGPQSYIQGRNAIAGAVVLTSKDPTFKWEGAVKGAAAEQSYSQTAAMISGPLIEDELALRISFDRQRRESFVELESYEPTGDPREVETTTARLKLLYLPSGNPGLLTRLSVNRFDTRVPQSEALVPPESTGSKFSSPRPVWETESTSGAWDVEWEMAKDIVFENKVVYTDFANERLTAPTDSYANIDGNELQVEPLVRFGGTGDRIRGLAGLRYFRATQDEFVNIYNGSTFDDKTETGSAYGEITYGLLSKVDVTFGGRFEHEHRERKGGGKGLNYGGTIYNVEVDFDETYSVFLPKLDMAWKPSDGHTLGAKVARGYRAGGAGITFGVPWTSYAFDEEYVWNYELYSRHRLLRGLLELTSNIFYNDYQDMQLPYYITSSAVTIINAEEARSYGAEISARWLPTQDLEVFGGIGLLKTEIGSFSIESYEGNELPRAPAYSGNLGALYRLGQIELSGNLTFTDEYYSYYDNDQLGKISAYWVADLQLAYDFDWARAAVFARNLFDDDHDILITDNDVEAPLKQRPRMVGVSLELKF